MTCSSWSSSLRTRVVRGSQGFRGVSKQEHSHALTILVAVLSMTWAACSRRLGLLDLKTSCTCHDFQVVAEMRGVSHPLRFDLEPDIWSGFVGTLGLQI